MDVIVDRPPLFELIDAKFKIANQQVIFAWGDKIYNPHGIDIPWSLYAHEHVHGKRQLAMGVEAWWHRYIDDREFRLNEEIPAHIEELKCDFEEARSRNQRRVMLKHVARRLASPIYGSLITEAKAINLLKEAVS